MTATTREEQRQPEARIARFEQRAITALIPHHRGAIRIAKMVLDRASHAEFRDLATKMTEAQQREIEKLTRHLRDWYGAEPPDLPAGTPDMLREMISPMIDGLMPDVPAMAEHLRGLEGDAFEQAALTTLIEHHGTALLMAAPILMRALHPELIMMVREGISSQISEMGRMQDWLKQWYGVTHPDPNIPTLVPTG